MAGKSQTRNKRFTTYRPLIDGLVFGLALLGILVVVHLWIQTNRGFDRGCFGFTEPAAVSASFDCDAVINSGAGKLFGVSNVFWGLLYYVGLAAISFTMLFSEASRTAKLKLARLGMITVGVLYSGYLSYYQYFVVGEFCKLCLISASIVMVLFAIQLVNLFLVKPISATSDMKAKSSFARAPLFGVLLGVTVLLAGADVWYFGNLEPPAKAVAVEGASDSDPSDPVSACTYDPDLPAVRNYREMVNFSDPAKGNPESDVIVVEFFDPNCPHCKTMHPIMDRVIAAKGDKALFVYRAFVLGQKSVAQVEALHVAAQEGKFFEMLDLQFERQNPSGMSIQQVLAIGEEIGMNTDVLQRRIERGVYRNVALRQRQAAVEAGIRSVPAVMINGRIVHRSSRNVHCLGELIDAAAG